MIRLSLLALFVNATATILREGGTYDCYYKDDSITEKGGGYGRSYRGLTSNAASGRVCMNWFHPFHPAEEGVTLSATPDIETEAGITEYGTGLGNHNYCRNPDPETAPAKVKMDKPWCYTADETGKIRREACSIEKCPVSKIDYISEAKWLTKVMMSTESTGNCMCAQKLLDKTKSQFSAKDLGLGDSDVKGKDSKFENHQLHPGYKSQLANGFLQKSRMGETQDGKPCFCED